MLRCGETTAAKNSITRESFSTCCQDNCYSICSTFPQLIVMIVTIHQFTKCIITMIITRYARATQMWPKMKPSPNEMASCVLFKCLWKWKLSNIHHIRIAIKDTLNLTPNITVYVYFTFYFISAVDWWWICALIMTWPASANPHH